MKTAGKSNVASLKHGDATYRVLCSTPTLDEIVPDEAVLKKIRTVQAAAKAAGKLPSEIAEAMVEEWRRCDPETKCRQPA